MLASSVMTFSACVYSRPHTVIESHKHCMQPLQLGAATQKIISMQRIVIGTPSSILYSVIRRRGARERYPKERSSLVLL
jgi:hypothetical protein